MAAGSLFVLELRSCSSASRESSERADHKIWFTQGETGFYKHDAGRVPPFGGTRTEWLEDPEVGTCEFTCSAGAS
jgi:hypothetical protein